MALLALLASSGAGAALPPTESEGAAAGAPEPEGAAAGAPEPRHWPLPTLRVGGVLAYDLRRDRAEAQERAQSALALTLNLASSSYLWEPWFARADGALGLTMSRDSSTTYEFDRQRTDRNRSLIMTGAARLSVLAQSRYPFEAHVDRNDSRVSTELALANGYASERYGFTQHYLRPEGDSMLGWDRNTQTSARNGRDRQDSAQLNLTHALGEHRLQLSGDGARNNHEASGESAAQENLTLQHSYAPGATFALENMANLSRSGYHLRQGDSRTVLAQLSSLALWRPEQQDFTVTGGMRLFALGIDSSAQQQGAAVPGARARNANANLGLNYELSHAARLYASANLNLAENGGARSSNASESVGASYQPASRDWGAAHYGWTASALAANRSGGLEAGRQFTAQLSHNLGRSVRLDSGASVSAQASEGLTAVAITGAAGAGGSASQITHGGALSWDLSQEAGAAMVRLSASDARTLGGRREFFQLVNLQASSNLAAGAFSSWNGSLTIQAARQGMATLAGAAALQAPQGDHFVPTSSAALSYQNGRLFGVRHLRFTSDLRLNGQSLLPLLGGGQDQETAAWDNRFDYLIGRTRLRVNLLVARSSTIYSGNLAPAKGATERSNRAIVFSLSRSFGNF
jgi:hypothetical protein